MKIWLISSIRFIEERALNAIEVQSLQTALALAWQGHQVLLWVRELQGNASAYIRQHFGAGMPAGLRLITYRPHGELLSKKTPFFRPEDVRFNRLRAAFRMMCKPDLIMTRSPLIIEQLRSSSLRKTRLALEWQYPEYMRQWRLWREHHRKAPSHQCRAKLRELRKEEYRRTQMADIVFYASLEHQRLLDEMDYTGPRLWLPSACLQPDQTSARAVQARIDATPYLIGFRGRLAPWHGIEPLLDAFAKVEGGRMLLLGTGTPQYTQKLYEHCKQLGIRDRVDFYGKVEPGRVREQLQKCWLGIVPISRHTGAERRQFSSPLKIMEWMSAGVGVIASDVPSISSRFEHDKDLWLTAPDKPEQLANSIRFLREHPETRREMARNGFEAALSCTFAHRAERITKAVTAYDGTRNFVLPE